MKFLLNIIKGGLVGIAAVIPGFSGGTIAILIGIYDDLINAIATLRTNFKKSFMVLLPYLIGIIIFALMFIMPITWGIDNHPLATVSLFAGLMLGGLPSFYKNIEGKGSKKNVLFAILGSILVLAIIIPSLFTGDNYISLATPQIWMYFVIIIMGMIASSALVVPGISGSMILLIIGFYTPIMDTIKAFLASLGLNITSFSAFFDTSIIGSSYIAPSLIILLCFAIGILLGFILISKLMKYLLAKHRDVTFFAIFGFILASLIGIYAKGSYYQNINVWEIVIGVILLIVGFATSFLLGKFASKKLSKGE